MIDQHHLALLQAAVEARGRLVPAVLEDPRYLVNTGHDVACPTCGSTNAAPLGKPETGLAAIGSIGFVLASTLVEAAVQSAQWMVFQCTYCSNRFYSRLSSSFKESGIQPVARCAAFPWGSRSLPSR